VRKEEEFFENKVVAKIKKMLGKESGKGGRGERRKKFYTYLKFKFFLKHPSKNTS